MIDIKHLVENPNIYAVELQKRGKEDMAAYKAKEYYEQWRDKQQDLEIVRQKKNDFNNQITTLTPLEKVRAIGEMKHVSEQIKGLEAEARELKLHYEGYLSQIPNLTSDQTPVGKNDADNVVIKEIGVKPSFDFTPKNYWDLSAYIKSVDAEKGASVMGSRGFYLRGDVARFQKVLFDFAEEAIYGHGFELMYVPLMLNERTMTEIGNLPDFDGQLYEVPIKDETNFYLIPSSEQSMMSYFGGTNLGNLDAPTKVMANTTCFRKEAGSYGKDQQGILRVHQFQKIEMNIICKPEDSDSMFALLSQVNEELYTKLGLYFRSMEVCSGDMPMKHYRQIDYEAWFPAQQRFREICSNGNASDFQNRGLKITYDTVDGAVYPWGLNCTGMVMRTGLAIMEQMQMEDGRVKIPQVLVGRFGKEYLE